MAERLISYALSSAGYLLEVAFLCFLIYRGHWKRLTGLCLYVASFLALEGGRYYALLHAGLNSRQYIYCYWLTDVLLTLAAFLLICSFFRRACAQEEKLWSFLRVLLTLVFILVLAISCSSLSHNFRNLFTKFIVEFQQNLYFTCAVLNALLYIMMQQIESADEELELLVCGLGIQYAGPAANLALVYIAHLQHSDLQHSVSSLFAYLSPLCFLGMLLICFYAVARVPKAPAVPASGRRREIPVLAEVAIRGLS